MRSRAPREANDPATPQLVREGDVLGDKYRIERCLGGGGMASIHAARHRVLDQPVAIKILAPRAREQPDAVLRFLREARAVTRLKGEHVVRVFDVGTTEDGAPYLVMELLEGKDLGALLEEGFEPTVEEAVDYTLQTCEALAEVHGLGIVHRDLKPANLFVTRGADGRTCLKLIDFGISRIDPSQSPHDTLTLTHPEIVLGSPQYMAPEQMESGASADSRSDIWSVGAILYELLVGRPPFDGESLFDIYAAAVREPPPRPSGFREGIPEGLDDVVLRCLRVTPAERWPDVAALAAALAPFGDANAAARAESIARVLETSRARGAVERARARPDASETPSSAVGERRGSLHRQAILVSAMVLLVAAGFAARPITERLERFQLRPRGVSAQPAPRAEPTPHAGAPLEERK